jgi:SAM-dependent methyltransferase
MLSDDFKSPLCGVNGEISKVFKVVEVKKNWEEQYGIIVDNEFGKLDEFYELYCKESGLYYFRPQQIAGSAHFYSQCERLNWYYEQEKWEFERVLNEVKRKKIQSVLEVGCGSGNFLKKLRKLGVDAIGLEINKTAADKAVADGLNVSCVPLDLYSNDHVSKFDCVVSFQVLEHIVDPVKFLKHQIQTLKSQGLLIISVPYGLGVISRNHHNLFEIPPHHMIRWSEQSFDFLMNVLPIKKVKVVYAPIEKRHYGIYLIAFKKWVRLGFLQKILEKQIVIDFISKLFDLGLARFFKGHTMIVIFEKI